ncbi:cell surface glycoprotein, partial [Halorubrum sp. Atlit-26R]
GSTFWSGQELRLTAGNTLTANDALQVRTWDSNDNVIGGLETEFSLNNSGVTTLDTSGLPAEDLVIVSADNNSQIIEFDNGAATNTLSASSGGDGVFEVATQSLTTEWESEDVSNGDANNEVDLTIESNRNAYDLEVSTDGGLDAEELESLFASSPFNAARLDDTSDDDYDTTVVLEDFEDVDEVPVSFQDVDASDYEFTFAVSDTDAEDTASLNVTEENVGADFSESTYSQTAGDIVEMTVELEDADSGYVQIGDEDSGFIDVLYVEDDDDDDEVTFQVNTRTLGTNLSSADLVYNSDDDIVESEIHGGLGGNAPEYHNADGNDLNGPSGINDGTFEAYLYQLDLIDENQDGTDQLIRPLQATTYDVSVNGDAIFIVNDDDNSELSDELDLATLDLTQPGVENIQTWTAPSDTADENDELEGLLETVTQRTDIAEEDRLVIQAESSGIYGHMVAIDGNFDSLEDGFSASTLDSLVNNRT